MKILIQMALRNIKANKKWAMMTISGITISVMLIATIIMFAQGTYESGRDQILAERSQWNAKIVGSRSEVPERDFIIDSFVQSTVGSYESGRILSDGSKVTYSVENFKLATNERLVSLSGLTQGRRPFNNTEAAVGSDILRDNPEITIGSLIEITDFEGEVRELEVVGIIKRTSYIQVSGFKASSQNEIYLQVDPTMSNFVSEVRDLFPEPSTIIELNTMVNQLLGLQRGFHYLVVVAIGLSAILIAVISLASIALIYNAFNLSIENKVKQIGLIQSVGASKKQIRKMVYFEGFSLSMIGITLGILLGYGLAQGIAYVLTQRFNALAMKDFLFEPKINLSVILIIFAVGLVSVFLPIRKGVRRANQISPIEAIRQSKTFVAPKQHAKTYRWMSLNAGLAHKNVKRSKSKHKGTTLSLVVTMVVLISVSTFIGFFQQQIDIHTANNAFDITVGEHLERTEYSQMDTLMSQVSSDSYQEAVRYTIFTGSVLNTVVPSADYKPYLDEGYFGDIIASFLYIEDTLYQSILADQTIILEPGADLVMNRFKGAVAKMTGESQVVDVKVSDLNVGDVLPIKVHGQNTSSIEVKVGGFIDALPDGVSTNVSNLTIAVLRPFSKFEQISDYSSTHLSFKAVDHRGLQMTLDEIIEAENYPMYVTNQTQDSLVQNAVIASVTLVIHLVAVFILLICISNVINVVVSGLSTRRRENAILRSTGMLNSDIRKMLIYEAVFTSVKPWVLGNGIGIVVSFLMYLMIRSQIPMGGFRLDIYAIVFSWSMILVVLLVNIFYSLSYTRKEVIIEDLKLDSMV